MKSDIFFVWDEWNLEHIAKHDVSFEEAEDVANNPTRPYPQASGNGKYMVRGPTAAGRYLQVIYVHRDPATIDVERLSLEDRTEVERVKQVGYIIHARDLSPRERRGVAARRRSS